ncbi:hypothetical protein AVEN_118715-1 [Araneus ventricosus]|uniref:Uncharacterized protein n=1 Tax=Araneus ventricosus TaxID=182803 RepID=A0A4Y2BVE1_ARAVE|nr:hypothetical protein AVEN_118715-1 [Araneus ventricosus]
MVDLCAFWHRIGSCGRAGCLTFSKRTNLAQFLMKVIPESSLPPYIGAKILPRVVPRKLVLQSWCEASHNNFTANLFCKWVGRLCFVTLQEVFCGGATSILS